ncbi:hypothetical protein FAM09_25495 [Niastella caeni]|uniref:SH3 domain-containing protein n=1 Tax=Niastella caeni TaxID=2569763 RepID=A0A4V4GZP6_9BACT|nr:hypothetical protein [Niastella caeni]THU33506.1 hypothetical protein FAM09_25495 [Niastella caeni]
MKNLNAAGLLVACIFAFQTLSAQQQPITQKPALNKALSLAQLPEKLECNLPALKKISSTRISEHVALALGNYEFAGEVVDRTQQSAGVMSMNIRSTNIPGAFCTVSVITDADNTQKLVGRIINPKSDDVLVLTEENNRYFWVKQPKQFFMVE